MTLSRGTGLGPYEIISPLGAGGMGEVYRARDSRLNREVAIKVLPASFTNDQDRLRRFEQEALATSALNHPNILTVHDFGTHEDSPYIVAELLEGEELRQQLNEGAMSLRKAIDYAQQITNGLAAAHSKGIVHRDLKPENIFITTDGRVKILDFGLAKLRPQAFASGSGSEIQTQKAITDPGTVMGTVGYMSPEQVRGQDADLRSDIFSFGVILYEMLSGQRAFHGESMAETMTAIVKEEPGDLSEINSKVPPQLERIVHRCLEKKPEHRFHSAHDLGFALEALSISSSSSAPRAEAVHALETAPSRTSRFGLAAWLATVVLVAGAASAAAWWVASRRPAAGGPPLVATITRVTTDSGLTTSPAVTPNGSLLAYASDRAGGSLNIWVQPLPDGQPVQVTHDDVDATEPNFSPDGSRIVFRSERNGGGIYVVPALGGAERFIVAKGRRPRFSPDGKSIAYISGGRGAASEVWVVDDGGGSPRRLASDIQSPDFPLWSPDGAALVMIGTRGLGETAIVDWWLVNIHSGAVTAMSAFDAFKRVGPKFGAGPDAWVTGEIIFSAYSGDVSSLWAIDVSSDGRTVTGMPRRLTAGVGADLTPTFIKGADGLTIYYANKDERANLYRLPLSGSLSAASLERVTDAAATDTWPSLSADGRALVFDSNRSTGKSVWLRDLASGRETPLTAAGGGARPAISPDGQRVAYVATTQDSARMVMRAVGGGATEPLPDNLFYAWSWPSANLLFSSRNSGDVRELVAVDPATGQTRALLTDLKGGYYGHGQLSPDGRWASAMEWTSADRARIILFPFRDTPVAPAEWIALTDDQTVEEEHVWSPRGDAIYFVSERDGARCIWMRKLDPATRHPVGPVVSVLHLHGARRSMISTSVSPQRIALGADALFFSVQEARGNIWKATLKDK